MSSQAEFRSFFLVIELYNHVLDLKRNRKLIATYISEMYKYSNKTLMFGLLNATKTKNYLNI